MFLSENQNNLTSVIPPCDLCGSRNAILALETSRLDGPLLRCPNCSLYFVSRPAFANGARQAFAPSAIPFTHKSESRLVAADMDRLAMRARELQLVEPEVEEQENHWRALTAAERLQDLQRFVSGGNLLEIGCSTGAFLQAATNQGFQTWGVEADTAAAQVALQRGLRCFHGALIDAPFPDQHFDVIVMYHVIEHLPEPQATLRQIHRLLRPGGWLVVETPDINTIWFRALRARWRQVIPDHIFFFSPATMRRYCQQTGFELQELRAAGKAMSVRLFISRVGRYSGLLSETLGALTTKLRLNNHTLRLNLGDVMRLYARKS